MVAVTANSAAAVGQSPGRNRHLLANDNSEFGTTSGFLYTAAVKLPCPPTHSSPGPLPSMRYFVIAALVCIVGSLFSALFFMFRDKDDSKRMVKALTLRVALSVTLFLLLMAGYYFGVIRKDGL